MKKKKGKLFGSIILVLVLSFVVSSGVFAQTVLNILPGYSRLSDSLETGLTDIECVCKQHSIGIRVHNVGGTLSKYLTDGDIILTAGKTKFSNCNDVFGCFEKEIMNAKHTNSPLKISVKDIHSGKIYKMQIYL